MLFVPVYEVHLCHTGGAVDPFEHPQRNIALLQPLHQRIRKDIVAQHGHFGHIAALRLVVEGEVDAVACQIVPVHPVVDINAVVCHCDCFFHSAAPLLAHDVDHIFAVFDAIVLAEINIRCAAQLDLALCDRKNAVVPREQALEMAGALPPMVP